MQGMLREGPVRLGGPCVMVVDERHRPRGPPAQHTCAFTGLSSHLRLDLTHGKDSLICITGPLTLSCRSMLESKHSYLSLKRVRSVHAAGVHPWCFV